MASSTHDRLRLLALQSGGITEAPSNFPFQAPTPILPQFPPVAVIPAATTRPRPTTLQVTQPTPSEIQATVSASEKPIRVCYGLCRIGAEIIWIGKTSGKWVFHLRWCWGEINSIVKIQLGNEDIPGSATITNYLGTTGQTADATLSALIGGYTDTLIATIGGSTKGIAYSVIEIPYDVMPDTLDFTCELEGLKVFDTRTSTTAYSTNPALHLYDFLTDDIYGADWTVLASSFDDLADHADDLISGAKRLESNIVIEQPQDIHRYVETLLGASSCFLRKTHDRSVISQFEVLENTTEVSAETFDLEAVSIDGSVTVKPINRRNIPNTVRVRYTDTTVDPWAEATAERETAAAAAGTDFPRITTVSAPYIHTHEVAYRLATEYLNGQFLPEFELDWLHKDDGVRLQRGDVVALDRIPGFSSAKNVRILRNNLEQTNGGYYRRISAREYQAGEYSTDVVAKTIPTLPAIDNPFTPTPVADLAASESPWIDAGGTYQTLIESTWTGVDHAHARAYRIKIVANVSGNILVEETILHQGYGVTHNATSPVVQKDILYTVFIWTISTVGAMSAAADTDTITPVGDALAAPAAPTTTSAVERTYQDDAGATHSVIDVTWTGVNDTWIREYRVLITNPSSDVILETIVKHLGVSTHEVSSSQVAQDLLHTVSVWSVNIEGDQSAAPDTDTVTPVGRTAVPPNITNLEATEYTDYVELEWDNVLGLGDTAHRIKRGTQAQTYSTADQLDKSVFMNPDARAEDRVIWRDYDVQSGDVGYYIKGISFEGLESATAAEVDITIQTPKGSRAMERPRIVTYIDEVNWLDEAYLLGEVLANDGFGVYTYYDTSSNEDNWRTLLDVSGSSGVLHFYAIGHTFDTYAVGTMKLGCRITLDGVVIFEQYNGLAIQASATTYCIVPVGFVLGTGDVDFHYLPFNDNLKLEIYAYFSGTAQLETRSAYHHILT